MLATHNTQPPANQTNIQLGIASPPHTPDRCMGGKSSLPQGSQISKAIQTTKATADRQSLLQAIDTLPPRLDAMRAALREYISSDRTTGEVAKRHGYTGPAMVYWIRKLGLPERRFRTRGRSAKQSPRRKSQGSMSPGIRNTEPQATKRRQPRHVIVSFRICADQWAQLSDADVNQGKAKLSGYEKARVIVENYLADSAGNNAATPHSPPAQEKEIQKLASVNVYNRSAA